MKIEAIKKTSLENKWIPVYLNETISFVPGAFTGFFSMGFDGIPFARALRIKSILLNTVSYITATGAQVPQSSYDSWIELLASSGASFDGNNKVISFEDHGNSVSWKPTKIILPKGYSQDVNIMARLNVGPTQEMLQIDNYYRVLSFGANTLEYTVQIWGEYQL